MELLITINSLKEIDLFNKVDGYVINVDSYSSFYQNTCSIFHSYRIINKCKKNNKRVYVNLDAVFFNNDFSSLEEYIDRLEEKKIDGYFFSDLGLLKLLKNKDLIKKSVYFSQTQIVSSLEFETYSSLNLKACFVSKDLEYSYVLESAKKANLGLVLYGYHNLFYSRRKLLTSYKDEYDLKGKFNFSSAYTIREQKRTTKSIVYENNRGTSIFTDYIDNHLKEYIELENNQVSMVLIDTNFISRDTILTIIDKIEKIKKGEELTYLINELEKDSYAGE